jgi:hypothetical protein
MSRPRLELINTGADLRVILSDARNINIQRVENGWILSILDGRAASETTVYSNSDVMELLDAVVFHFGHTVRNEFVNVPD